MAINKEDREGVGPPPGAPNGQKRAKWHRELVRMMEKRIGERKGSEMRRYEVGRKVDERKAKAARRQDKWGEVRGRSPMGGHGREF